jgi:hypothetical protein
MRGVVWNGSSWFGPGIGGRPPVPVHIFERVNRSDRCVAHGDQDNEDERQHGVNIMVDARKYAGSRYLKVADVRVQPLKLRIERIKTGKYDKLDAHFDNCSILSLNSTNTSTLLSAWGWDTDAWHDKEVALTLGTLEFQNKEQEAVIVTPLSPPLSPDQIRKPPPLFETRDDDEIPF